MSEQLVEQPPAKWTRRTATNKRCGTLFPLTPSDQACGVEVFTRELVAALNAGDDAGYAVLPVSGRWRELPALFHRIVRAERVAFSLPLVAWKRMLAIPMILLLFSVLTGRRVSVFLHEWAALHGLRRIVSLPFVALSHSVVLVSPFIRDQIANDRWIGWARRKCRVIPHPPTVRRPPTRTVTERVRSVEQATQDSDIVIGSFGSIYQGKASAALLDVCEHLRSRGVRASVVFIGSFTKSLDNYEERFRSRVRELKLDSQVIVTGYVEGEDELFALFERIGVFLFLFPEGLTARRSSVIACLQSGRPVVVTAPRSADEFSYHQGFRQLIDAGAIAFIEPSADIGTIAERLLAVARQESRVKPAIDPDAWWEATKTAARAAL